MSEYIGKMHIVKDLCGHVFAACWVTDNDQDARSFSRRYKRKGYKVETIDRFEGDPMPEWCSKDCVAMMGAMRDE